MKKHRSTEPSGLCREIWLVIFSPLAVKDSLLSFLLSRAFSFRFIRLLAADGKRILEFLSLLPHKADNVHRWEFLSSQCPRHNRPLRSPASFDQIELSSFVSSVHLECHRA